MEKKGVIEPGTTPLEEDDSGTKQASEANLEEHLLRRVAQAAQQQLQLLDVPADR